MAVYDVVTVGAGPAGSRAAYAAARRGLKTCLVEEHTHVGKPSHCAGKLYAKAFQEFSLSTEAVINKVRGALIHSPSNIVLAISKSEADSYIVEREAFDLQLSNIACDSGAVLITNAKCFDIQKNIDKTFTVKLRQADSTREIKTKIIIDAEGWNPILANKLLPHENLVYLKGAQYEMENVSFEREDHVELFFGSRYFPGFFGWIIPLPHGRARVGLCIGKGKSDRSAFHHLNDAIKSHPAISQKTKEANILKASGGYIPIHGPINKTFEDGFLAVGDTAGHVKSTTGGGIYFALKAGEIAGKTAAEQLTAGETDAEHLRIYQTECAKAFGRELKFTSSVRKASDRLSDQELDRFLEVFASDNGLKRKVEKYGDTAYQSRLLNPLTLSLGKLTFREPRILLFYIRIILDMIG